MPAAGPRRGPEAGAHGGPGGGGPVPPLALAQLCAQPAARCSLGQFALECLHALGLLAASEASSAAVAGAAQAARWLLNPFAQGRAATLSRLHSHSGGVGGARFACSATDMAALAPTVVSEWTLGSADPAELREEGIPARSKPSSDGRDGCSNPAAFGIFLHECLHAASEALNFEHGRDPPSQNWKRGIHSVSALEWAAMAPADRLVYEAAAAATAPTLATGGREVRARVRGASKTARAAKSPPRQALRSPSNAELYGEGGSKSSDEVFAHSFARELLDAARARVARGAEWVLCVRTYGRSGLEGAEEGPGPGPRGGVRQLTLRFLEQCDFLRRPELLRRAHVFVSHEDPHFTSGRYEAALGPRWAGRLVVGLRGADLQTRFIEECFCRGQHVVVCDDNLLWVRAVASRYAFRELRRRPCELAALFRRAGAEMGRRGAHLWGISPTSNLRFMKPAEGPLRVRTSLGLVYGALFGFICCHEAELYTQFGQVKDDVERTLRYWHRDRLVLRFTSYACTKRHRPGAFRRKKGGISAGLDREAHRAEGAEALRRLAAGPARRYVRLPARADRATDAAGAPALLADGRARWRGGISDCGLVFCGRPLERATAEPWPGRKLAAGYACRACRRRAWGRRRHRAAAGAGASCSCVEPLVLEARRAFLEEGLCAAGVQRGRERRAEAGPLAAALEDEWAALSAAERQPYRETADARLRRLQWIAMDGPQGGGKRARS